MENVTIYAGGAMRLPQAAEVISGIGSVVHFLALNTIRGASLATSTLYKVGAFHGTVAYFLAYAFDMSMAQKSNEARHQVFKTTGVAIGFFCTISDVLLTEKSFFNSVLNPLLKYTICTVLVGNTLITQFKGHLGSAIIEQFPILKNFYPDSKTPREERERTFFSRTFYPIVMEEDSLRVVGLLIIGVVTQVVARHLFSE